MNFRIIVFFAAVIASGAPRALAGESRLMLHALASADTTEVHPDGVFEVTLSLQNPTGMEEIIQVPECGWDKNWKSSNHLVLWDPVVCDEDHELTIKLPPHSTYVFPKTLDLYVDESVRKPRVTFSLGFRVKEFGKVFWSNPISLDVIQ